MGNDPQLEMTPMIDVVFQLLIFFIVAMKQEDILSRLMAARPAGRSEATVSEPSLINIVLHRDGFLFRGRPMTLDALDRQIARCAELSTTASVVIKCTADSPHKSLVQTLDICSKHGLGNLSIFSM